MKKHSLLLLLLLGQTMAFSQVNPTTDHVDLAGTIGSGRGTAALSYVHNWRLFKKQKWEIGLGLRFTSGFGEKQEYTTAPAKLARTSTIPFVIVLSGQKTENWDTLTVQRPLVNSLNLSANFGYHFNAKWSAGFNIDLIGFSFGQKTSAILTSNGVTRTEPVAKVVPFNLLLTGDLDKGTLNSELFLKYKWNKRWGARAIYQFYFTEYETTTINQVAPDGTEVYRFRQKQNNFGLGLSYQLGSPRSKKL
jgi:hypothetical protein